MGLAVSPQTGCLTPPRRTRFLVPLAPARRKPGGPAAFRCEPPAACVSGANSGYGGPVSANNTVEGSVSPDENPGRCRPGRAAANRGRGYDARQPAQTAPGGRRGPVARVRDRPGREQSVGRRLDTGAPLTGEREHDEPDFAARTAAGFPVIGEFSHLRRARSDDPRERIFRRGDNYDEGPPGASVSDAGLLFASYQADVDRQFVPLQRRLDELDLLNRWTTPIGSAVFAVPPGCEEGGYVGETLV